MGKPFSFSTQHGVVALHRTRAASVARLPAARVRPVPRALRCAQRGRMVRQADEPVWREQRGSATVRVHGWPLLHDESGHRSGVPEDQVETAYASETRLQLAVDVQAECGCSAVCGQCGRLAGICDGAAGDRG